MKFSKFSDVFKWVVLFAVLIVVFVGYPRFIVGDSSERLCNAINANRREGSIRATVLTRFINDAAKARDAQAQDELRHKNFDAAITNFQTAAKYRALKDELHKLPELNC